MTGGVVARHPDASVVHPAEYELGIGAARIGGALDPDRSACGVLVPEVKETQAHLGLGVAAQGCGHEPAHRLGVVGLGADALRVHQCQNALAASSNRPSRPFEMEARAGVILVHPVTAEESAPRLLWAFARSLEQPR